MGNCAGSHRLHNGGDAENDALTKYIMQQIIDLL